VVKNTVIISAFRFSGFLNNGQYFHIVKNKPRPNSLYDFSPVQPGEFFPNSPG
jgi:hypothetical protein